VNYPLNLNDSLNVTQADEFLSYNIIGRAPKFLAVLKKVKSIAKLGVTVTIYGETGTGKELIARAIHYSSPRAGNPFIPVNCGALPDNLFENEMFGHERGAFTDASKEQVGLIAQAEKGTLFLDEIEALTPKAQVALLRFLQDKTYRSLGGKVMKTADVRIVAASNESFDQLIEEGSFRTDLFYRLNLIPLKIPPLRERTEDILLLTDYFTRIFQHQYQQPAKHLTSEAMQAMQLYHWPGNVRELESTLHRAFLLSEKEAMAPSDLFERSVNRDGIPKDWLSLSYKDAKYQVMKDFEQRYLGLLMDKFEGNITAAARHSGKDRSALSKLLKKHNF
jgi:transcriptional regulator with PAS, ATPase and Fis domain